MSYVSIDAGTGAATLENQTDRRRYVCTLEFDEPSDAYDCKRDPSVGALVEMVAQGLKSQFCTGGDFGGFGVAAPGADLSTVNPRCDYTCVLP